MNAMLRCWWKQPRRMCREIRGNVAVAFAVSATALLAMAGLALDYVSMINQRSKMQSVADSAALNTARELALAQTQATNLASVAVSYAQGQLSRILFSSPPQVSAAVINNNSAVQVDITEMYQPTLARVIWQTSIAISVRAVARASGPPPTCVLALDGAASGAIYLGQIAMLTGTKCAVYSDSTNPQGIKANDSAVVKSAFTCSAGGQAGSASNFSPMPITGCPQIADPLASRVPPSAGPCSATSKVISGLTVTLTPGTYCNGLTITGAANVTLSPGVYIIKDGPFVVDTGSSFQGSYVGLYLLGAASTLLFAPDTTINLTAPKDGALSGILVFEDRAAPPLRLHRILSANARTLLGTFYLSQGRLIVDPRPGATPAMEQQDAAQNQTGQCTNCGNGPSGPSVMFADKSAYTIIIARRLELYGGPNLVLNTDYAATDIPVPAGVGPIGVALTQ
jgi:Flp pilus assembly protein TadG